MGYFSWVTSDTNKSICNIYSGKTTFPVYVLCPDQSIIREDNYEGNGIFGGRDIYALVAIWNVPDSCKGDNGEYLEDFNIRDIGLKLVYKGDKDVKYPIKIVENPNLRYDDVITSKTCKYQGYFY